MNKYIYISCLAIAGLFASCDDILDAPTKSSMDEEVIFSTEALADGAVMGLHQSFGETNSYRGRYIPFFGINNDCEIMNGYHTASTDKQELSSYYATANNGQMNTENNAWAKLYEAIERANKAISSMEVYGNIDTDANMGQLYGELLTLRGMIYFDLVKAWGDVPYRFEPITSSTIYLPKTDRVTVLNKVMEDLLLAENYLGWPNENSYTVSVERVSKSFAKSLRARAAMFLAGQSEWPNEGLRYNLTDESARKEMYTIALNECKDIIEKGCNKLGVTFDENFRALCQDIVVAGNESIFEIPFSAGRGRVLYTWGVKHQKIDQWTGQAQGGANRPIPTLWYDYEAGDTRREITCVPYSWSNADISVKEVGNTSGAAWCFGKLRYEWMTRRVTSTNDDGVNFQVMRYADVLLMAAEAENQLNGPSNATQYLKPVLDRAFQSATEKVTEIIANASASQTAFQNVIEEQRKLEFAGEAIRKVDLMRWGKLSSSMAEAKGKMERLANRTGEYAGYPTKVYFNDGLDAATNEADKYTLYGLEDGHTDAYGKENFETSKNFFRLYTQDEIDSIDTSTVDGEKKKQDYIDNNTSINGYINALYTNDPNSKMFWPIWTNFINSSNGMLINDYGY